jgi:hypothetical protein
MALPYTERGGRDMTEHEHPEGDVEAGRLDEPEPSRDEQGGIVGGSGVGTSGTSMGAGEEADISRGDAGMGAGEGADVEREEDSAA